MAVNTLRVDCCSGAVSYSIYLFFS